jgi:hypothetical protein
MDRDVQADEITVHEVLYKFGDEDEGDIVLVTMEWFAITAHEWFEGGEEARHRGWTALPAPHGLLFVCRHSSNI